MSKKITRRALLETAAVAAPAAVLAGCCHCGPANGAGTTENVGVSRVKRASGGRGRPPEHAVGPFPGAPHPPEGAVSKRVKWDFERFVKEILKRLDDGQTDTAVNHFAVTIPEQEMDVPGHGRRSLNVRVFSDLEFEYGTDSGGARVVTGVTVRGCLARYTGQVPGPPEEGFDMPFQFGVKTCSDVERASHIKHNHLVYSSSLSSSSWGIP